ncbi:MAG: hypothetical protein KY445_16245 [Armatimonadetes bacterium]|nr:hypothetical protein [Armatimonadota bacterium]
MNQFLLAVACTGFLLLPIFVLSLRALGPRWFTGLVALCVVALGGWFLVNAVIYFHFENLGDQLRALDDNPPPQLAKEWANDGAKRVFGVLFGGFYALIYYAPFALIYEVARGAKRFGSKRRAPAL